ncbi:hypothetical protein [Halodesulfovibrio sp.]|uniref:hypothetical protein n=1 Tax=Halodesulfovibrio sp. TaxID=1912772 RepID=UPI0025B8A48C|nr:hypothetical protein [Halodesulfovibrio sp.]
MSTKKEKKNSAENISIALGNSEVISRHGSANTEFIVAYTGVNNETEQILTRSHKSVAKSKVNPNYKKQNLKQQSGFSAELAKTSRDNAENILAGSPKRTSRTDDLPEFGANHPVYDHVEMLNGKVIPGSGSQMKFSGHPTRVMDKIAKGEGGGKADWSRYQNAKITMPSEQVNEAREYCRQQAEKLRKQSEKLTKEGNTDLAAKKAQQADNFDNLSNNIEDSGVTSKEALFYREHPKLSTLKDITKVSHRAGMQGAKYGATIGGSISVVTNILAVAQDDKNLEEALVDTAIDTTKAAATGYGTAFSGSILKGLMQQSKNAALRNLSRTNFPGLVVTACIETTSTIRKYVNGDIDGVELFTELGEKTTSTLAGSFGATLGQIAIPLPIAGAVIGGMVGYMLSSIFYAETLQAFTAAKQAREQYEQLKKISEQARTQMRHYRTEMDKVFTENFTELKSNVSSCLDQMSAAITAGESNAFCWQCNQLGSLMGATLQFQSFEEFNSFMNTEEPLVL